MSKQKIFFSLLLFVVFSVFSTQAQMKKKAEKKVIEIGGGISGGDFGVSTYGPNFNFVLRKTAFKMGKNMNTSLNLDMYVFGAFLDYISRTEFGIIPVSSITFNLNALTGAYPNVKSRSPIGGFLGFGALLVPTRTVQVGAVSVSGDFGPMANAGFRIRPGKHFYFTVKVYGGVAIRTEWAFGGLNFTIPIGKKDRKFGSHACKKHSKRTYR